VRAALPALLALALAACGTSHPPISREEVSVAQASRSITNYPRFHDTAPHAWEGRAPWHYPMHGIDVSKWQGPIDWGQVRASGVDFAFIKATEGGDILDDRFAENWAAASRAGVARGAYHFYYFCRSAAEQARWFKANAPTERGALPPVLDMEWNHRSKTCRARPQPEVVRSEMRVWKEAVASHYGQQPIIYTTVAFYRDNELWQVDGYVFWLRSVAGHPQQVYPGQSWTFWQYTGTGSVPGIVGNTDINVFAGSPTAWAAWLATRKQ
jgi:lysozyme